MLPPGRIPCAHLTVCCSSSRCSLPWPRTRQAPAPVPHRSRCRTPSRWRSGRVPSAQVARSTRDAARYRNDAFNARLRPQLFLSGQRGESEPRHQRRSRCRTARRSSSDRRRTSRRCGIGFSQQIPLTGGTISVGSAGQPPRPLRHDQRAILSDVARRRQPPAGSVQAAQRSSGTSGRSRSPRRSPSADISRRAKTWPATRPTHSSICTRSR